MHLDPRPSLCSTTLAAAFLLLGASIQPTTTTAQTPVAPLVVGSPNTATADPLVTRPNTKPTVVPLFSAVTFTDFNPRTFAYAPPANPRGPWAKIVFVADFSVSAGRQFDRTAQITIGNVNVYYGTTAEPSATVSPTWHVERDVTDDAILLATAQPGAAYLGNLVNGTYTGIIQGSAHLEFYPTGLGAPAARVPDVVIGLPAAAGGAVSLSTGDQQLTGTLALPRNIERAYLDIFTQSQGSDEFWYTSVPNDLAAELQSSPGTAFREAEISVDGQPAGVAPVYPWIYTGGIDPYLWRPIPGVQTLNFVPFRVDLTPFAGLLSNGTQHQVSLRVAGADNYFLATATLYLYLDRGSTQVTGGLTANSLKAPTPVAQSNISTASGYPNGTVSVTSTRRFTVAGYVQTSHGRVDTAIQGAVNFSNQQNFTISATQYVQDIHQTSTLALATLTQGAGQTASVVQNFSYPLALKIAQTIATDGSSTLTTTVAQQYQTQEAGLASFVPSLRTINNEVDSTDTLQLSAAGAITGHTGQRSRQRYTRFGTTDGVYDRQITAADGVLTGVSPR